MKIQIKNRWTDRIILSGKYESIKDCLEKNRDTYLEDANLRDAYLRGVNLRGAYLEGVNLRGAQNYYMSHEVAIEIIRRQPIKFFTPKEWAIIGQIYVHRLCWEKIKKDYKQSISIFKKLDKLGYGEYLKKFKEL